MSKTLMNVSMRTKTHFYYVNKLDLAYLKNTSKGVVPVLLHKGTRVESESVEGKYFHSIGILLNSSLFSLYKEEIITTLVE